MKEGNNGEAVQLLQDVRFVPIPVTFMHAWNSRIYIINPSNMSKPRNYCKRPCLLTLETSAHSFYWAMFSTKLGKSAEAQQHFRIFEELEKSEGGSKSEKPTIYTQTIK